MSEQVMSTTAEAGDEKLHLEPVSPEIIQSWLIDAGLEANLDPNDNDVYIPPGELEFPIWVRLVADQNLILLITHHTCRPDADPINILNLVNRCNEEIILPSFWTETTNGKTYLMSSFYISMDGGVNRKQFLKMARRFSGAVRYAGDRLDHDRVLE